MNNMFVLTRSAILTTDDDAEIPSKVALENC